MSSFFSYHSFTKMVIQLVNEYPALIKYEKIGVSYDNRDIIMLRFGIGKKGIFLSGGVHARETINPFVLLKMFHFYAKSYKENAEIFGCSFHKLYKEYTFYLIPLLNPDGFAIALEGFSAIQNKELRNFLKSFSIPSSEWKFNGRGVDINRNFPCSSWKKKSETDSPASEKETQCLIQIWEKIPSIAYIDYHSRGKTIYYYRNAMSKAYNERQYEIAKKLEKITGYCLENPKEEISENDSGGNTVHYYSENFKKPAITIETVAQEEMFPLPFHLKKETFQEIFQTPFYFLS